MLCRGNCTTVDGVNDVAEFAEVVNCLGMFDVSREMQDDLWRVLAALVWLGEVGFLGDDSASLASGDGGRVPFDHACQLIGLDSQPFLTTVVTQDIKVGGELIKKKLDAASSLTRLQSSIKRVYEVRATGRRRVSSVTSLTAPLRLARAAHERRDVAAADNENAALSWHPRPVWF